jgi:molybdopterin-binding protein
LSRNWLDGTVESIEVGSVRAVVKIRLKRGGQTVTASVTKEVINDLELRERDPVVVLVEPTDITLAVYGYQA